MLVQIKRIGAMVLAILSLGSGIACAEQPKDALLDHMAG